MKKLTIALSLVLFFGLVSGATADELRPAPSSAEEMCRWIAAANFEVNAAKEELEMAEEELLAAESIGDIPTVVALGDLIPTLEADLEAAEADAAQLKFAWNHLYGRDRHRFDDCFK